MLVNECLYIEIKTNEVMAKFSTLKCSSYPNIKRQYDEWVGIKLYYFQKVLQSGTIANIRYMYRNLVFSHTMDSPACSKVI